MAESTLRECSVRHLQAAGKLAYFVSDPLGVEVLTAARDIGRRFFRGRNPGTAQSYYFRPRVSPVSTVYAACSFPVAGLYIRISSPKR